MNLFINSLRMGCPLENYHYRSFKMMNIFLSDRTASEVSKRIYDIKMLYIEITQCGVAF